MRRLVLAAALLLAGGAASAPSWGPPLLRETPWMRVARVEVSGARLLAPHQVLAASGIRMGESVWADPAPWEAALRGHPVVAGARVERRLPGTLVVRVTEKRAAALLDAGTLVPATAQGEVLPVDPARVPLDLPVVRAGSDSAAGALLALAGRLGELDPALAARVSEVRPGPGGSARLALSAPAGEVVLPAGVGEGRLRGVRAALADVEARLASGAAAGPVRLDARFAGQVVVRFGGPHTSALR